MLLIVLIRNLEKGCSVVAKVADATSLFRVVEVKAHNEELHTDLT